MQHITISLFGSMAICFLFDKLICLGLRLYKVMFVENKDGFWTQRFNAALGGLLKIRFYYAKKAWVIVINLFCRWERRPLDAYRRRLRRNSLYLSWISIVHWRNRTRQLVCLQPIQVDDGAFRLLRHVVTAIDINLFLTKNNRLKENQFLFKI